MRENDRLIMEFNIIIKGEEISSMDSTSGNITIIPFGGDVHSELFTGEIRPGAADVQVSNPAGIRHMCAKYMFTGKDISGNPCSLFVENNGYFEPESTPGIFHAYPVFMTDSATLAPYLTQNRFRSEGHPQKEGVLIKIYDTGTDYPF